MVLLVCQQAEQRAVLLRNPVADPGERDRFPPRALQVAIGQDRSLELPDSRDLDPGLQLESELVQAFGSQGLRDGSDRRPVVEADPYQGISCFQAFTFARAEERHETWSDFA